MGFMVVFLHMHIFVNHVHPLFPLAPSQFLVISVSLFYFQVVYSLCFYILEKTYNTFLCLVYFAKHITFWFHPSFFK